MKKEHNIKLAFNTSLNTHSLKRIIAYYYKEYIELDNKFENITQDQYSKIMIAKVEKAKTEKEINKIAKEYAENTKKYYSLNKKYSTLSFNNQVNRLNGYIEFKSEYIENQFELPLIDFISYDLNNINEYIVFFINFFDFVIDKLDKEDLDKIKLNTLYEIKFISELAKKYYDKVVNDVKKMQTIFKICIDLVYELKINDYTKALTKEQRFFVFNQVNNYPFKEIANNFRTINSLDYSYDYIDTKIPEIIASIIKATDLEGKEISQKYKY